MLPPWTFKGLAFFRVSGSRPVVLGPVGGQEGVGASVYPYMSTSGKEKKVIRGLYSISD